MRWSGAPGRGDVLRHAVNAHLGRLLTPPGPPLAAALAANAAAGLHETLAAEPRVMATTIRTVGGKGRDGFTRLRVSD